LQDVYKGWFARCL